MEEIVNYPEIHQKLMKLPCYSRKTFIDVLHKICLEESNDMMGVLDQSRNEIQDMASSIQKEQKAFKETLQELKTQRTNPDRNTESRMSTVSEGVTSRGRMRKKNKKASNSRPISACSLPSASSTHITIEQEKETVFRNLDSAGVILDNERKRQAARLEELKSRTRQKQTDNAHKAKELMEEADNLSKMLDKCKIEQQGKVKEIVENQRKKHTGSPIGAQTIYVVSGNNSDNTASKEVSMDNDTADNEKF